MHARLGVQAGVILLVLAVVLYGVVLEFVSAFGPKRNRLYR